MTRRKHNTEGESKGRQSTENKSEKNPYAVVLRVLKRFE